jgi:ATP-dependent DNA helicase DinG
MAISIPSRPYKLGLSKKKFPEWRQHQQETVEALIRCQKRFPVLNAPTGSGKSLTYSATALLLRLKKQSGIVSSGPKIRVAALTATKALQDQLTSDFEGVGLTDVRGMGNYPCAISPGLSVEDGPCHSGMECDLKKAGCSYFDAVRAAKDSWFVCTNYDYWLHADLGNYDVLILDEAHNAAKKLASHLGFSLSSNDCKTLDIDHPFKNDWLEWAIKIKPILETRIKNLPTGLYVSTEHREFRKKAQRLLEKITRLVKADPDKWICEAWMGKTTHGWKWDVIDPSEYKEVLFKRIKKVILVSATVTKMNLKELGIPTQESEFFETPSTFKVKNRPVYIVKTGAQMRHDSDDFDLWQWVRTIDKIIGARLDRKGIIHPHSYRRQEYLLKNSKYRRLFICAEKGQGEIAVARYKRSEPPSILMSPAVKEGVDFPYDECRYQIICKVPFPDSRSPLIKARRKVWKKYSDHIAMQELVQASGRPVRADDDWAETFLVDDNFVWFVYSNKSLAPKYWMKAVKRVDKIPLPPRLRKVS